MSCTVRSTAITAKPAVVSVNGVVVPRDAIAREVQHHPAPSPAAALEAKQRAHWRCASYCCRKRGELA